MQVRDDEEGVSKVKVVVLADVIRNVAAETWPRLRQSFVEGRRGTTFPTRLLSRHPVGPTPTALQHLQAPQSRSLRFVHVKLKGDIVLICLPEFRLLSHKCCLKRHAIAPEPKKASKSAEIPPITTASICGSKAGGCCAWCRLHRRDKPHAYSTEISRILICYAQECTIFLSHPRMMDPSPSHQRRQGQQQGGCMTIPRIAAAWSAKAWDHRHMNLLEPRK